jgi:surface-anchored protein
MKLMTILFSGLVAMGIHSEAGNVTFSNIHGDLDMGYEDGQLTLIFHDHTDDIEFDPRDVILRVNPGALTTVPSDEAYTFLGAAGSSVWILPAVQDANLLFLGTATEEIEPGIFQGDTVRLSLKEVKGPGEFAMFAIDPFGVPVVLMNTRDGINEQDGVDSPAGGHTDYNFAFSKAGRYHVTLEATGTLLNGTFLSSGEVTYTFEVLRPGSRAPRHTRAIRASNSEQRFHIR